MNSSKSLSLGLLLARLPLGAYFLLAGYGKVFKGSLSDFVNKSMSLMPSFMPESLGRAYLYALPFAEMLAGATLILGLFTRVGALLASLLLISIVIAQTITGGVGPFHHGIVFLGASLLLLLAGGGGFSLDATLFKRRKSLAASQSETR
jgi:uncharacterized membrane protein YphA (DoxX/SURF4 family)